jgi:hypothetical protein
VYREFDLEDVLIRHIVKCAVFEQGNKAVCVGHVEGGSKGVVSVSGIRVQLRKVRTINQYM